MPADGWRQYLQIFPCIFDFLPKVRKFNCGSWSFSFGTALMFSVALSKALNMWRQRQADDVSWIEKSPREIRETSGSTALLILSVFFPRLWLIDITGMSLYWVVRPWYRSSIRSRPLKREHQKFFDGRAIPSGRVILCAERFFQNGRHRFVAGLLCGAMSIGLVWGASVWKARDAGLTLPDANKLFPDALAVGSRRLRPLPCCKGQHGRLRRCNADIPPRLLSRP